MIKRCKVRVDNYVYIMKTVIGKKEYYKIGVAKNPEKRLKAIQTGCPVEVVLEHYEMRDEAYKTETYLHMIFHKYKTHGEWFSGDDLSFSNIRCALLDYIYG